MSRAWTDETILEEMRRLLADAQVIAYEDITPESKLVEDLRAESIDFLDIHFRIGKTFECMPERSSHDDIFSFYEEQPKPLTVQHLCDAVSQRLMAHQGSS